MNSTTPIVRFVTLDHIEAAVVRCSGVMAEDMRSPSRHKAVVRARRAFVLAARAHTTASFPEIARRCTGSGGHSAAIQLHKDGSKLLTADTEDRILLSDVLDSVNNAIRACQAPTDGVHSA